MLGHPGTKQPKPGPTPQPRARRMAAPWVAERSVFTRLSSTLHHTALLCGPRDPAWICSLLLAHVPSQGMTVSLAAPVPPSLTPAVSGASSRRCRYKAGEGGLGPTPTMASVLPPAPLLPPRKQVLGSKVGTTGPGAGHSEEAKWP